MAGARADCPRLGCSSSTTSYTSEKTPRASLLRTWSAPSKALPYRLRPPTPYRLRPPTTKPSQALLASCLRQAALALERPRTPSTVGRSLRCSAPSAILPNHRLSPASGYDGNIPATHDRSRVLPNPRSTCSTRANPMVPANSLITYSRLSPSLSTLIARPHPPPLRSEFPRLVLWYLPMTSAPLPYRCSLQHAKTGALPTPSQIELPLCLLFSHLPALICFRCQAISRTFARGCDSLPCRRHGVSCRKALTCAADEITSAPGEEGVQ